MENKATITTASLELARARKEAAHRITRRNTLYSAGVGLLPFPLIDAAVLLALQLHMLRSIARLYQVDFRKNLARSLIGSLAGYAGAAGLIKALPGLGSLLGGATTAVAAAASTYATGKIFTHHFDQGGTLLDFDPVRSRQFFLQEFEAGRMFVSAELSKVNEDAGKGPKALFGGRPSGKKQQREENERQELRRLQEELKTAISDLKEII